MSAESDRLIRSVIHYLLHTSHVQDWGASKVPLWQILSKPEQILNYSFNENVLSILISDAFIVREIKQKVPAAGSASHDSEVAYAMILAAILQNRNAGLPLRTLVCRHMIESISLQGDSEIVANKVDAVIPPVLSVLDTRNLNLRICATATLVNFSCNCLDVKVAIFKLGGVEMLLHNLKGKDDELQLHTLKVLVNLTKLKDHRAVVVERGLLPLLVDILTSSYRDLAYNKKILIELFCVIGQLCNDERSRFQFVDDFPVVDCLLWIFDASDPYTNLRSKLLFALRQICGQLCRLGPNSFDLAPLGLILDQQTKLKVGSHIIRAAMAELGMAKPQFEDCAMNLVLLLTVLGSVGFNAKRIKETLEKSLRSCRVYEAPEVDLQSRPAFSLQFMYRVRALIECVGGL
jgi:hypothetical protein